MSISFEIADERLARIAKQAWADVPRRYRRQIAAQYEIVVTDVGGNFSDLTALGVGGQRVAGAFGFENAAVVRTDWAGPGSFVVQLNTEGLTGREDDQVWLAIASQYSLFTGCEILPAKPAFWGAVGKPELTN